MRITLMISGALLCSIAVWQGVVLIQRDTGKLIDSGSKKPALNISANKTHENGEKESGLVLHGIFVDNSTRIAYISIGEQPQRPFSTHQSINEKYRVEGVFSRHVVIGSDGGEFILNLKNTDNELASAGDVITSRGVPALSAHSSVKPAKSIEGLDLMQKDQYAIDRNKIHEEISKANVFKEANFLIENNGVFIERIQEGSVLESIGLHVGDTITKVNNSPITSLFDVLDLYNQLGQLNTIELQINRMNQPQYIYYELH